MNFAFFINSILLGVGLAMDAFSVSIVNGLADPEMKQGRKNLIAGTFAAFQLAMPMIGWVCVSSAAKAFTEFQKFIPYIALILLLYIGGKMLIEGIRDFRNKEETEIEAHSVTAKELIIQGIATSIDALSVGFTIADYNAVSAFVCSLIIALVTFIICRAGILLGRKFGERLSDKATILGGLILIGIGIEIFVTA